MNKYAWILGIALAGLSGCVGANEADLTGDEDLSVDEVRSAGDRLVGAWTGTTGPFTGLVFTNTDEGRGRHFFMDVDNGIRCVRAPCDSTSRVEGYFTAGALTVTLTAVPAPTGTRPEYLGRFYYTLQGSTLTLTRSGRIVARLSKQTSYCAAADDCAEQRLITPRCLGRWTCESNACRYQCGRPTCASTTCAPGTFCMEGDTGPTCITNCARVRCASGTQCVADANGTRCEPVRPTCATVRCGVGTICVEGEQGAQCITACATVRCTAGTQCVADAEGTRCEPVGVRCGTTTCAAGYVCCNPLRNICTRPGMVCIQ